jgi:adenosine deaminase CECR1
MYKWYISNLIDQLIADKVMYAELRPMLLDKGIPTDDGKDKLTIADQMRLLVEGVKEKQDKLKNASQGDLFPFGLKIIYCTPRSISKKLMQVELMDCIKLKKQYPDLVCGKLITAWHHPLNWC